MIVEQVIYHNIDKKEILMESGLSHKAQWVLIFGSGQLLKNRDIIDDIRRSYPNAYLMGCSTAGEIYGSQVDDNSVIATAVFFEKTSVRFASVGLAESEDSFAAAKKLAQMLPYAGLKHIFVLSEGLNINGSHLISGLHSALPVEVNVTGGLSADGSRFQETLVITNKPALKNIVAAAAFYGDKIRIGNGSCGGWSPFGIERLITKSKNNILYELDGRSALDLYKEYLGEEYSKQLPFSALYFPLSIRSQDGGQDLVRTILGVDGDSKSLRFAGNVPEGYYAKFMKASSSSLTQGAMTAAINSMKSLSTNSPKLAILISCVGRKLVLKQMVDEEIEETRDILGPDVTFSGFYSYGEISSTDGTAPYALHNQTMTITLFDEILE